MKKMMTLFTSIIVVTVASTSYAETFDSTANTQTQTQSQTQQKPTVAKIDTNKQENKAETTQQGNSVYDNIRWGWNKFIDVLAGPAQKK